MKITGSNSLRNVGFLGLCGIQTFKIIYMSYVGKVFESLTDKFQYFQKF